jgi:homoserine O-acetyltransferase
MEIDRRTGLALGLAACTAPLAAAKADPLDAVTTRYAIIRDFRLRSGVVLPEVKLAYESYGTLNAAGTNAVLMTHGYTGGHHAAGKYAPGGAPPGMSEATPGSWDLMIGAGKPIDPARHFIVASNMLGSSYGSTNGASLNPATGQPYGPDFPEITVADIATAQYLLLRTLGVNHLLAVMGTSYGGFQAFQWATTFPEMMHGAIAINTAPWGTAVGPEVRENLDSVTNAPGFNGGRYYGTDAMLETMVNLRVGTLKRYGLEAQLLGRFPEPAAREAEIRRQALPWARAFDPNSLIILGKAIQRFDTRPDFGRIKAKMLYALTTTDKLFPPSLAPQVMAGLKRARVDAQFFEIRNEFGHIGAGVESPGWVAALAAFMKKIEG